MLGRPKPEGSGRKKGQPNKVTGDLRAVINERMPSLTAAMLDMADDPATKPDIRLRIWEVAARKVLPDLSATTLNPDADGQAAPLVIHIHPPSHDSAGNPLS